MLLLSKTDLSIWWWYLKAATANMITTSRTYPWMEKWDWGPRVSSFLWNDRNSLPPWKQLAFQQQLLGYCGPVSRSKSEAFMVSIPSLLIASMTSSSRRTLRRPPPQTLCPSQKDSPKTGPLWLQIQLSSCRPIRRLRRRHREVFEVEFLSKNFFNQKNLRRCRRHRSRKFFSKGIILKM